MVKVSIDVCSGTARFAVRVQAHSLQQALNFVAARYPGSVGKVRFPLEQEGIFVKGPAEEGFVVEDCAA